MSKIVLNNTAAPDTPSSGKVALYTNNKKIYSKDSDGTVVDLSSATASGVDTLAELTDVNIGAQTDGQALVWDNSTSKWIPGTVASSGTGVDTLAELTDVNVSSKSNGQALTWNEGTSKWIPATISGGSGATTLAELTDVNVGSQTDGQALVWDNGTSKWIPGTIAASGGGATTLDGLTDVVITDPATGEVLRYNGSEWADSTLNLTDLGDTNESDAVDGDILYRLSEWTNALFLNPPRTGTLYYTKTNATISGYYEITPNQNLPTTQTITHTINVVSSPEETDLLSFVIPSSFLQHEIPTGLWYHRLKAGISEATASLALDVYIYKRDAGGTETQLGQYARLGFMSSASATLYSVIDSLYDGVSSFGPTAMTETDTLVIKIRSTLMDAWNGRTITFYIGGDSGSMSYAPISYHGHSVRDIHNLECGMSLIIGTGSAVVASGIVGYVEIPYDFTLTSATLVGDQSGSMVVDLWKDVYASFPPTDADSITASTPPTLSSAQKVQNTTLSGWDVDFDKGEWLAVNVDSCTTITQATLALKGTRKGSE